MDVIFGFDIGTTSIGWAVIRHDKDREIGEIVCKDGVPGLGVRIFPEARDPDGTPLNQTRRQKRMMRRQLRRRKVRRRALNEALANAGLLPPFSKDKESEWATLMAQDPYPLRLRALTERLDPYHVGRALYHLAQRRHFKGRDLEDEPLDVDPAMDGDAPTAKPKKGRQKAAGNSATDPNDEKKLKEEILSTHRMLKERKITLGAWLAKRNADAKKGSPPTERRREVHAHRVDVEAEFEALWNAQSVHHEVLKTSKLKEQIAETIFKQNPVFWRKNTLGSCRFMPGEELCPKGSWLSQQRRMLEKLNNVSFSGGNARALDPEERAAILAILQTQGSMTWGNVRKALKPILKKRGEPETPKFNLELDDDSTLLGNPLEGKLADVFGDGWAAHPHKQAIRDAVHERLWNADYAPVGQRADKPVQRVVIRGSDERKFERAKSAQSFIDDFAVTQEQAAKLRDLKLPTGWEPFSIAALKKFLPKLEEGHRFGALLNSTEKEYEDWRRETFPGREQPTGEVLDLLPSPNNKDKKTGKISVAGSVELKRIAALRNPTVVRTQNELRKVVNNLIRVYGKPDLIRIELARDVGKSKREREEDSKRNRKNERERKKAIECLKENNFGEPSRSDIEKWALWQECNRIDVYTGLTINFDDLFRTNVFEVEHIWPRATSLDNGFANKTLCHREWNSRKGKRTPFEAFGSDDTWDQIKRRVWERVEAGTMSKGKAIRFCREEPLPDDFTSRQLNDTGYAARQGVSFLKRLWPDLGQNAPVNVHAVSGRVTDQLRRRWELNNILSDTGEKTRADHRHHAIDALVVACAHPGVTNRLSRFLQEKDTPGAQRPHFPPPWQSIRIDAAAAVEKIVVSHRVRKKVSGPLHKETTYGDTGDDVRSGKTVYRQFVTRKKVDVLTKGELEEIRDQRVGDVLRTWVEGNGGDPKKAFATHPTVSEGGAPIKKVRLLNRQQMSLMAPVSTGYAVMGSNHHVVIWRLPSGETDFEVVSMFEATRRLARKNSIVDRQHSENGEFVMSLVPGDTVEFARESAVATTFWRVQKLSGNGQVYFLENRDASKNGDTQFAPTVAGLILRKARKISVDPIGRVRPARD